LYLKDLIDEFHKKHIHNGIIHHTQCTTCNRGIKSAKDIDVKLDEQKFEATIIPRCKNYNCTLRPNISMFGDITWDEKRVASQEEKFDKWPRKCMQDNKKLLIIELGAGKKISHIRDKSEHISKSLKTKVTRINTRDYRIDERLGVNLECGTLVGVERVTFVNFRE
jgi:hypothetical protein